MERVHEIIAGSRAVPIPCYFPSVSSVKTNLSPVEYIRTLVSLRQPLFLVSAYDIDRSSVTESEDIRLMLRDCGQRGATVLLDSGNYESFWKSDATWTRDRFHAVLRAVSVPLAFTFDNQNPSSEPREIASDVEKSVLLDQAAATASVLPIIHAQRELLPELCVQIGNVLRPMMIAVPERVLGHGILERGRTVLLIRSALSRLSYYCPIHLLGTGNPLSLLIYALCGADSFDGLEWCQTVVDHQTGRLHHFQHWDLYAGQTQIGTLVGLPYSARVFAHNLIFYNQFLERIRAAIRNGSQERLLSQFLDPGAEELVSTVLRGAL